MQWEAGGRVQLCRSRRSTKERILAPFFGRVFWKGVSGKENEILQCSQNGVRAMAPRKSPEGQNLHYLG